MVPVTTKPFLNSVTFILYPQGVPAFFLPIKNQKEIRLFYSCANRNNTISKSKMILRRLGEGDEAYYTYVEEADNDANKNSALI
jgi:hypothetical protein